MRRKDFRFQNFQTIVRSKLTLIKGGNNDEEYELIYIDGKPYRIKKNKIGEPIYLPEEIY